jgi:hypothetical protein
MPGHLARLLKPLAALVLSALLALGLAPGAAHAARDTNSYDGNIYALYAGNGSLVPPRSTLAQAMADHRVAVVIYYLDDSAVSKRFTPVVSELQRVWGNRIDLLPLVTDPLQNRDAPAANDPAAYWRGTIPQVVVIDREGKVAFDAGGQVPVQRIHAAVSDATGIPIPPGFGGGTTVSVNELNTEVRPEG